SLASSHSSPRSALPSFGNFPSARSRHAREWRFVIRERKGAEMNLVSVIRMDDSKPKRTSRGRPSAWRQTFRLLCQSIEAPGIRAVSTVLPSGLNTGAAIATAVSAGQFGKMDFGDNGDEAVGRRDGQSVNEQVFFVERAGHGRVSTRLREME